MNRKGYTDWADVIPLIAVFIVFVIIQISCLHRAYQNAYRIEQLKHPTTQEVER